jgi:hypothetical protein
MAESIAIYFSTASSKEIGQVLDEIARPARGSPLGPEWTYPPEDDNDVLIYEYRDIFKECEDNDLEQIKAVFGGLPPTTFCIELRRSKGKAAFDTAERLAVILLSRFPGMADDLYGDDSLWRLEEIEGGVQKQGLRFLDIYRRRLIDF